MIPSPFGFAGMESKILLRKMSKEQRVEFYRREKKLRLIEGRTRDVSAVVGHISTFVEEWEEQRRRLEAVLAAEWQAREAAERRACRAEEAARRASAAGATAADERAEQPPVPAPLIGLGWGPADFGF